jgi:hypothetical protein
MYLEKFVHTDTGRIIMSFILGLGLATFFREICKGDKCLKISAPPLEEIEDKIYKFDNKCYKMEKIAMACDNKKHIYDFQM